MPSDQPGRRETTAGGGDLETPVAAVRNFLQRGHTVSSGKKSEKEPCANTTLLTIGGRREES